MSVVTMLILLIGFALGCALGAASQIVTGLPEMTLSAALLGMHLV